MFASLVMWSLGGSRSRSLSPARPSRLGDLPSPDLTNAHHRTTPPLYSWPTMTSIDAALPPPAAVARPTFPQALLVRSPTPASPSARARPTTASSTCSSLGPNPSEPTPRALHTCASCRFVRVGWSSVWTVCRSSLLPDRHVQDAAAVQGWVHQVGRLQGRLQGDRVRLRRRSTRRYAFVAMIASRRSLSSLADHLLPPPSTQLLLSSPRTRRSRTTPSPSSCRPCLRRSYTCSQPHQESW